MSDTIAAIATPPGRGGIAIVRLSGDAAEVILRALFRPAHERRAFEPNRLMYGHALDDTGAALDEVMAVFMRRGASYTGEDVGEIHCHGGDLCAAAVLGRCLALGARPALPGEFTRRAFEHGRMDLSQAEAVARLIAAGSDAAMRAGARQLEGGVSAFVQALCEQLEGVLAGLEAAADFPEEISELEAAGDLAGGLDRAIAEIDRHLDERGAKVIREGALVVLAGRPNVGKSSLMNRLLARERAIVTEIPGTTRDVLTERVMIGGVEALLSDTAGLRDTGDQVERMGVDRARRELAQADVVLLVLDAALPLCGEDEALLSQADDRFIICLNKTDLAPALDAEALRARYGLALLTISAVTGDGTEGLIRAIADRIAPRNDPAQLLTTLRHVALAKEARAALVQARQALDKGVYSDMCALDIRRALQALGEITGRNVGEDVIDKVFAQFCVGK